MHRLFSSGLILAIVFSPLRSLPILDPNEISFRIPGQYTLASLCVYLPCNNAEIYCSSYAEEMCKHQEHRRSQMRTSDMYTRAKDGHAFIDRFRTLRSLLTDSKIDFGDVSSWDDTHLLQNLPSFLDKGRDTDIDTDDIFSKEGLSLGAYNMDDVMKEELFDKQPQISLLSRLQSKERKPYKKRAGNLSECFWKYCV